MSSENRTPFNGPRLDYLIVTMHTFALGGNTLCGLEDSGVVALVKSGIVIQVAFLLVIHVKCVVIASRPFPF